MLFDITNTLPKDPRSQVCAKNNPIGKEVKLLPLDGGGWVGVIK
jgi:hypothetical protein